MLILDGSHPGDATGERIAHGLRAHRPDARTITLLQAKIGNCAGDFRCWVRTPGMCTADDDNRRIAAEYVRSDLVVLLTPVTFGGYSSQLKRGVDHLLQVLSPDFQSIQGQTHHRRRYKDYPDLLVIGWTPTPDPAAETVFRHLVARNALNLHAGTAVCQIINGPRSDAELVAAAQSWLQQVAAGTSSPTPDLPGSVPQQQAAVPPRRAVLLVGSPRTTHSSSHALGSYLLQQLEPAGVSGTTICVHTQFASPARRQQAQPILAAADLLVLAFPLYVDGLSAPLTAALEHLAAQPEPPVVSGAGRAASPRLVAIANCGFPESAHNATALAICQQFARRAGYDWAGGLALGGGEGLVQGRPLPSLGGRGARLRQALDLAAADLAAGGPVSPTAIELLGAQAIPAWAYRAVGKVSWRLEARRNGAARHLKDQPYAAMPHAR